MEPIGGITRGLFNVGFSTKELGGTYAGTYWMSLRPCPTCGKKLFANGHTYVCNTCGFTQQYVVKRKRGRKKKIA